jgi:hypothetical protein
MRAQRSHRGGGDFASLRGFWGSRSVGGHGGASAGAGRGGSTQASNARMPFWTVPYRS